MVAWASPPHECAQEEAAGVRTGNLRRQSADECRLRKTAGSELGNSHLEQTQPPNSREPPDRGTQQGSFKKTKTSSPPPSAWSQEPSPTRTSAPAGSGQRNIW